MWKLFIRRLIKERYILCQECDSIFLERNLKELPEDKALVCPCCGEKVWAFWEHA